MDDPALDENLHMEALNGIRRLNKIGTSMDHIFRSIEELANEHQDRKIKVLDLATGSGDIPVALYARAVKTGLDIEFAGCDISSRAVDAARRLAKRAGADVDYFQLDVLNDDLPPGFDVFTSSLFFHHLDEPDIVSLLTKMSEAAGAMLLVNDLIRDRLHYWLALAVTRLVTRSSVVHSDGPVSVRAAYTVPEMEAMALRGGLQGAVVERHFPYRFVLEWRKPV